MLPTIEKTYPPEVAEMRQFLLDQIEEVKRRHGPPKEPQTAIQMMEFPRTPQEYDRALRRYRAEIEPFVQQLLKIEAMAPITMTIRTSKIARL